MRRLWVAAFLGLLVSLVCAPAASAQAPPPIPILTLSPSAGPIGTHVSISGQLTPSQVQNYKQDFVPGGFFTLIHDYSSICATRPSFACSATPASLNGCELLVATINPQISLDPATGRVSGAFIVGSSGVCFQDRPDSLQHSALPGGYDLAIGCHGCGFATFTVTGAASSLPFTGIPTTLLLIAAGAAIAGGVLLTTLRRRIVTRSPTR